MTEQTPVGEAEKVLGSHPSRFEVAERASVPGKGFEDGKVSEYPELNTTEDFTDPQHPLYGTVDEYGRRLPGWLEQITVRYAPIGEGLPAALIRIP